MDKIDLPMPAGKRMESNNLAELKPVWKNLYVRLSKNFCHASSPFSGQLAGAIQFKHVVSVKKPGYKSQTNKTHFTSFLLFVALNRSDIVMNFIDCFNCFKL